MNDAIPLFHATEGAEELRKRLRAWEPWSVRIDFDNGVSTNEFRQRVPFGEHALSKFSGLEEAIPFAKMAGGRLLDIGSNCGYNSIHAAQQYGYRTLGIDVNPRHIEVSRFLANLTTGESKFSVESAEEFSRPDTFDIVLHFGTLYHLPNPLRSLSLTYTNLRAGGYLGLETQVYDNPNDSNLCYFMHMQNNDPSNFWALSSAVLEKWLGILGFSEIEVVKRAVPAALMSAHMSRILLRARKPE